LRTTASPARPVHEVPRAAGGFVKHFEVVQAWARILQGYRPTLSIEITRECPLRCPGCYAYEDAHLNTGVTLRQLADHKGDALVDGVLALARRYRPLHISIVGGDPLVRYREIELLVPRLHQMGIFVQIVTSAFRQIPSAWATLSRVKTVVSIDGLQPEHDARRAPATYERILKNIAGHRITVHCTITGQMMKRPGYLAEFLDVWSPREEVAQIWMSIFTPQKGAIAPEILSPQERKQVVTDLLQLQQLHPKLDMREAVIQEFLRPPSSPAECIFAQTTHTFSADLKTKVVPCQFGGNPDCSQCGCVASMALAAVGHHKVFSDLTAGQIYFPSAQLGKAFAKLRPDPAAA